MASDVNWREGERVTMIGGRFTKAARVRGGAEGGTSDYFDVIRGRIPGAWERGKEEGLVGGAFRKGVRGRGSKREKREG